MRIRLKNMNGMSIDNTDEEQNLHEENTKANNSKCSKHEKEIGKFL